MKFDKEKYDKSIVFKIDKFSGKYMSDTKWTKLFETLSKKIQTVNKCFVKSIWDDLLL
jgi:hypothetical protein